MRPRSSNGYATIVLVPEGVEVPAGLRRLEEFRAWARSDGFPGRGRIDWVGGRVEIDMSPEDLFTHGTPKSAISRVLGELIEDRDLGYVFIDATRLASPEADLSAEPDVVVVLEDSIEAGRVRLTPKATGEEGRFVEVEGAADLVVECVSDASAAKDRTELRERYHRAGVREYWLVDARGAEPAFTLHSYAPGGYAVAPRDADGFLPSAVLGVAVRLVRRPAPGGRARYRLEARPPAR